LAQGHLGSKHFALATSNIHRQLLNDDEGL